MKRVEVWLLLALLFRVFTAFANIGFVALDDYSDVLMSSVPAQSSQSVHDIIQNSGIRSPIPKLATRAISLTALFFGFTDPADQIRAVYLSLGLFSMLSLVFAWKLFQDLGRPRESVIVVALMGLHFVMPFLSTRTLIESMAGPFIMMGAYGLSRYVRSERLSFLITSLVFIALASVFRFQAGVCGIVIVMTVMMKRKWSHVPALVVTAAILFGATGLLDLIFRGTFHASLREYVAYNVESSSSYGVSPWWVYVALFIGLLIPPFLLSLYRGLRWSKAYNGLESVGMMFLVFVLAHSFVPHKEPRFIVTVLPLFFCLTTPLFDHLLTSTFGKFRVAGFAVANLCLLMFASFSIAQNNVVGVARFTHQNPTVTHLLNYMGGVVVFPTTHTMHVPSMDDVTNATFPSSWAQNCSTILAVRGDFLDPAYEITRSLKQVRVYQPGFLEGLMIDFNPEKNGRRRAIYLFSNADCQFKS